MRSRVIFPVLSWGFFLEGEDSHGEHGLGSLVELRFKAPPGTSYSYITIHLIRTMLLRHMGVQTSEVSYTLATTRRGDHKVHKGHVVALGGGEGQQFKKCDIYVYSYPQFPTKPSLPQLTAAGCWINVDTLTIAMYSTAVYITSYYSTIHCVDQTKVKGLCFQSLDRILQKHTLI
jgi:hypothetical protein